MVTLIDHRHDAAETSGTVMVVMIRWAWFVMRSAGHGVLMMMIVLMHLCDDIAGVGCKGSTVHANEHAENHDGLEKNSHVVAPKIDLRACGSRHFAPGPFLDMIRHRGFVEICLLPLVMAFCDRC